MLSEQFLAVSEQFPTPAEPAPAPELAPTAPDEMEGTLRRLNLLFSLPRYHKVALAARLFSRTPVLGLVGLLILIIILPNTAFLATDNCSPFVFQNYIPSVLEETWEEQSGRCAVDSTAFCACSHASSSEYAEWLRLSGEGDTHYHQTRDEQSPVLSKFVYQRVCRGRKEIFVTAIEPLADGLRYPGSHCNTSYNNILNKSYMILAANQSANVYHDMIYMDLGASLYKSGSGGASQEWFIESYARNNLRPSRMLLWEAKSHPAPEVFKDVPDDLHFAYQWINIPASSDQSSPANPLNILKKIASDNDFVALKIDIDNGPGELEFVAQIENDGGLVDLVDEFFFEFHVNFPPMVPIWGASAISEDKYLPDAYGLFSRLRKRGIRAHSWV